MRRPLIVGSSETKMTPEDMLATVQRHYPEARSTADTVDRLFDLLNKRFGLRPNQIIHADSICSDDVNSIEYAQRAFEMLGPFKLGGLGGFPFAGLTAMAAFAAHVPDEGAVFLFHAPHIGISKDGTVGAILRVGQQARSGCCGACRAALAKLLAGEIEPDVVTEFDYQQNTLEQILHKQRDRIERAAMPLMEATEVLQEAISDRIDELVARTTYKTRYVILMGAVLINGDYDVGAFTAVRRLLARDLRTGEVMDLLAPFQA